MSRARVLVVTPSLGGGGAERHLLRILPNLVARFDVGLAILRSGGVLERDVPSAVTVHAVGSLGWITAARRLRRLIRTLKPAVALSVQEAANIPSLLAVRTLTRDRPRVAVSTQSAPSVVLADSKPRTRARVTLAMRRLYPGADRLIAPSTGVAGDLAAITGVDRKSIAIIYNAGVDAGLAARASEPIEHPYFDGSGVPVLVACGRLTEQKAYPTLLAAVDQLRAGRAVRAVILGDGPLQDVLAAEIRTRGLEGTVDLAGFVSNPYPFIARASVFVLTSRSEGFGNVLAEALACGVPIVATDCPHGPAEILDWGTYGHLVPPGDPAAFAAAVGRVLDDPAATRTLAARGPERAEAFTADRSAEAHVALIDELLR
jgi:glycosyltransferase involved in cell wall biosynthesis